MIKRIIFGIDHIDDPKYNGCDWVCKLAEEYPREFFHCFNKTGKNKLGEKRIKVLMSLTEYIFIYDTDPENVRKSIIIRMLKNALK